MHSNPSALLRAIVQQTALGAEERIRQELYLETRSLIVMVVSLFCDLVNLLGTPRLIGEGNFATWRKRLQDANDAFVERWSEESGP